MKNEKNRNSAPVQTALTNVVRTVSLEIIKTPNSDRLRHIHLRTMLFNAIMLLRITDLYRRTRNKMR